MEQGAKKIADCGMRIAECRRHRAEGIGKDDRGQRGDCEFRIANCEFKNHRTN